MSCGSLPKVAETSGTRCVKSLRHPGVFGRCAAQGGRRLLAPDSFHEESLAPDASRRDVGSGRGTGGL